ncbi:hypothetical protein C5B41_13750 [Acinetobacter ursingii]|uniref:hypothetical protein n=1 Tax=Acinetobacter ursingii TaxID=108980 RepID=UPI000CF29671|nr:hypothetical protein [Acinetobacter ursingii]PPZ93779.1 hypothetical protein C5B41_13750 [Acinetobacter ursingii]
MALRQKRNHRYNVNLTDDESKLFEHISKMTGEKVGIILRQAIMKQTFETLFSNDVLAEFNLEEMLNKGAEDHLSRS